MTRPPTDLRDDQVLTLVAEVGLDRFVNVCDRSGSEALAAHDYDWHHRRTLGADLADVRRAHQRLTRQGWAR